MRPNVADIIDAQHDPRLELPLNPNVHLHGAGGLVVRVKHGCRSSGASRGEKAIRSSRAAIGEVLSDIGRIWRLQIEWRVSLIGLLQCDDCWQSVANQRSAR